MSKRTRKVEQQDIRYRWLTPTEVDSVLTLARRGDERAWSWLVRWTYSTAAGQDFIEDEPVVDWNKLDMALEDQTKGVPSLARLNVVC